MLQTEMLRTLKDFWLGLAQSRGGEAMTAPWCTCSTLAACGSMMRRHHVRPKHGCYGDVKVSLSGVLGVVSSQASDRCAGEALAICWNIVEAPSRGTGISLPFFTHSNMPMAALESAAKFGVPQPVAASQPLVAVKPTQGSLSWECISSTPGLQPEVTSLKAAAFW